MDYHGLERMAENETFPHTDRLPDNDVQRGTVVAEDNGDILTPLLPAKGKKGICSTKNAAALLCCRQSSIACGVQRSVMLQAVQCSVIGVCSAVLQPGQRSALQCGTALQRSA